MTKLPFFALSSALLAAAIGACGGRVIVDGMGAGGAGAGAGTPAYNAVNTGSSILSGPSCNFPVPVGTPENCSATASTGTTMAASCVVAKCDKVHNQFVSNCTGQTCICSFNPATGDESFGCTCSLSGSCDLVKEDCCPFQF